MGCLFGWVLIFYWLNFFCLFTEKQIRLCENNSTFASYWELRHGHNGEKYNAALVYKRRVGRRV